MEMLFTYLAISKILYWYNNITAMGQGDILGTIEGFLLRFVYTDLGLILGVVFFYFFDKLIALGKPREQTIFKNIIDNMLFYVVGYVALMAISTAYSAGLAVIEGTIDRFSWSGLLSFVGSTIPAYIVVCVVLSIKEYSKRKGKEIAECETAAQSKERKLTMLESLLSDGILSREEYEAKKGLVTGE